jgi:hypothetical protein
MHCHLGFLLEEHQACPGTPAQDVARGCETDDAGADDAEVMTQERALEIP